MVKGCKRGHGPEHMKKDQHTDGGRWRCRKCKYEYMMIRYHVKRHGFVPETSKYHLSASDASPFQTDKERTSGA